MNLYDIKVENIYGVEESLEEYKGKVLLIINSATECGFTPQYDELQDLYEVLGGEDFEILDFPCNQFGNQAPGSNDEIVSFCDSKFGITFPMFSKVDVNGENASPLFTYLKSKRGFTGFNPEHPLTGAIEGVLEKIAPDYKETSDIKWNFTKFLVDQEGHVVARFEPTEGMDVVGEWVRNLL